MVLEHLRDTMEENTKVRSFIVGAYHLNKLKYMEEYKLYRSSTLKFNKAIA